MKNLLDWYSNYYSCNNHFTVKLTTGGTPIVRGHTLSRILQPTLKVQSHWLKQQQKKIDSEQFQEFDSSSVPVYKIMSEKLEIIITTYMYFLSLVKAKLQVQVVNVTSSIFIWSEVQLIKGWEPTFWYARLSRLHVHCSLQHLCFCIHRFLPIILSVPPWCVHV